MVGKLQDTISMANTKKFGSFGGVFTPSILTILGVIMYLRLGWIVAQTGFYYMLALIVIAHIISISTGLSLSSIATDKKIEVGGIYYMLSRSLGLPMGGSIGITIFLGTALSISLYVVGFVESFLGMQSITDFLHMTGSANDIRLIGTAVIITLIVIAYISTSVAIKTQFFILAAIFLSLVSVIVGIFLHTDLQASTPALLPVANAPDIMVLFAVFFPAATGFTAGVAMSGDLKSPRIAIPKGTLWAIGVGLFVYILLAALFAFFVDRDLMLNDTNFLLQIAWWSPLVIAGIWGATLSSALGGILGAPRILQAMSGDNVTPRFFAKGIGDANEPRRALILTFLLAEAGILIGDLDAIAGVVTMFYIAAYGFINLAYTLERWANSDFRPSLKIPIWIGIVGFVASMGVMIKLDTMGMIIAFVIMFGIYAFLRRKQVQGNMTDVWQSVWTSVVRSSLNRIDKKPLSQTNWQPNIILFSGGGKARPHLLELGIDIAGKQGFLSNFDLLVQEDASVLFPKSEQKLQAKENEEYTGVFTRRQSVKDIYQGIEMIAQTYGFSGVEPNTVMMGWARQSSDPVRFTQLVHRLSVLDMNVILLDYDKRVGWGERQSIDIWWEEGSKHGNLALSLVKFITLSKDWHQAKVRLLIVNPNNEKQASMYTKAANILSEMRVRADIRIINNELEQRSFYDIIQVESVKSDLIFIGFPINIEVGKEQEFVDKTNTLCANIGTVAIIHASSRFKSLHFGDEASAMPDITQFTEKLSLTKADRAKISEGKTEFLPYQKRLFKDVQQIAEKYVSILPAWLNDQNYQWSQQLINAVNKAFDYLEQRISNQGQDLFPKIVAAQVHIFVKGQTNYSLSKEQKQFENKEDFGALEALLQSFQKDLYKYPYRVKSSLSTADIKKIKSNISLLKRLEYNILNKIQSPATYYVHLRELLLHHYPNVLYQSLLDSGHFINKQRMHFHSQRILLLQHIGGTLENCLQKPEDITWETHLQQERQKAINEIKALLTEAEKQTEDSILHFRKSEYAGIKNFIDILQVEAPNRFLDLEKDAKKSARKSYERMKEQWQLWEENQELAFSLWYLNLVLIDFRFQAKSILNSLLDNLSSIGIRHIQNHFDHVLETLQQALDMETDARVAFLESQTKLFSNKFEVHMQQVLIDEYNRSLQKIKSYEADVPELLSIYANLSSESTNQNPQVQKIDIAARKTLEYIVEREMGEIRQSLVDFGHETHTIVNSLSEVNQNVLAKINKTPQQTEPKDNNTANVLLQETITQSIEQLLGLKNKWNEMSRTEHTNMRKHFSQFSSYLELYPFIREVETHKQYLRSEKNKEWLQNFVNKNVKYLNEGVNTQFNKLWYAKSSAWSMRQKVQMSFLEKETRVETLLDINSQVRPKPEVLQKLPDFYKQLFLHQEFYLNEFWIERQTESACFQKNIDYWRAGYGGGILVLGERHSGKSFFINKMTEDCQISDNIYHIQAPYTGSISTDVFLRTLQHATEIQGGFAKIFNNLPPKSILVIDDLELWWEKSEDGMQVIQLIQSLINRFGKEHLFLVSCNGHAYSLINKYQKVDSMFLGLIELKPFNAYQLKKLIMKRHLSTNLSFTFNKTQQQNFREWNYARLFTNILNYSGGNPGVALHAWINAIDNIEDNTLIIKTLKQPDMAPLDALEPEWLGFIINFILHKRMHLSKLTRVNKENRAQVILRVRILQRAGILIQAGDDIIDINPYLLPFLRKALIKREFI